VTTLCIDTSTLTSFVAIGRSGEIIYDNGIRVSQHSQQLMPQIYDALAAVGCSCSELDAIAIGTGPGSFTALRVGMATVKGLAVSAGLPVIARSSLQSEMKLARQRLAKGVSTDVSEEIVILATDARRSEVFVHMSWPSNSQLDGKECAIQPTDLIATLISSINPWLQSIKSKHTIVRLIGSGIALYDDQLQEAVSTQRAAGMFSEYDIIIESPADEPSASQTDPTSRGQDNIAVGLYDLIYDQATRAGVSMTSLACDSLATLVPTYIRLPDIRG